MLVALHLVFGQSHDCGIRSIGWFLELSELYAFIASSYGSQQKVASLVEQWIGQFGQQEDQRLGQQMPKRNITLCEKALSQNATELERMCQETKERFEAATSPIAWAGSHSRPASAARHRSLVQAESGSTSAACQPNLRCISRQETASISDAQ